MWVIIDIQNELLLKLHQLNGLIDLRALWDFAIRLNEGTNLFAACHLMILSNCVNRVMLTGG